MPQLSFLIRQTSTDINHVNQKLLRSSISFRNVKVSWEQKHQWTTARDGWRMLPSKASSSPRVLNTPPSLTDTTNLPSHRFISASFPTELFPFTYKLAALYSYKQIKKPSLSSTSSASYSPSPCSPLHQRPQVPLLPSLKSTPSIPVKVLTEVPSAYLLLNPYLRQWITVFVDVQAITTSHGSDMHEFQLPQFTG